MGNQRTFASMAGNGGKVTRREPFLAEMDAVIPWPGLVRLIEPQYPKAGQGRQPLGLEEMRRIYFSQRWFNLSNPQARKTRSTIANRCFALSGSSWATRWCPMRV
jgi:IS5 family transposase